MSDQTVTDLYISVYNAVYELENPVFRFYHDIEWLLEEYFTADDVRAVLPSVSPHIIGAIQQDWIDYCQRNIVAEHSAAFDKYTKDHCRNVWNLALCDNGTGYENSRTQARFEMFAMMTHAGGC